jgi:hypothetical protein
VRLGVRPRLLLISKVRKAILAGDRQLARVIEMSSAEGVAVVNEVALVVHIQGGEAHGEPVAERLAHSQVDGRVAGEMGGSVPIQEA